MGNTDHTDQFKLVKDPQKKWINDFLMKKKQKLVTLYVKVSTIHDTDKKLEIEEFFLKMINKKTYIVDLSNLSDILFLFEFAKEMYFQEKASRNKNNRERSFIRLLKSHAILAEFLEDKISPKIKTQKKVENSKETKTRWLSSNPNELCDSLNLILKEKQAGFNSNKPTEKTIAITGNFMEDNCVSQPKQHSILVEMFLGNLSTAINIDAATKRISQSGSENFRIRLRKMFTIRNKYKKHC